MRIVIAPDSFKGALSALEVCRAIEAGLRDALGTDPEIVSVPLADGGEGTVQALVDATGGRVVEREVTGPLGEPVDAFFGMLGDGTTAAIEMAAASGLPLVPPDRRDPRVTTTRGTGELIDAALAEGAEELIIGIGGSATNDGGAGMAQALGFRLVDEEGRELPPGGAALADLAHIEVPETLEERLASVKVRVACDVDNPLCGPRGASHVYGPQKGASHADVRELDAALRIFAEVVERDLGRSILDVPGSGAAGGLGGGLMAFLGGELLPGVDIVVDAVDLAGKMDGAHLCLTAEGQLDDQTPYGKTPTGAAKVARQHGVPVIALGGAVRRDALDALEERFDVVLSISPGPGALEDAIEHGAEDLRATARQIGRLVAASRAAGENRGPEAHVSSGQGQG
ncbi:MAG: glycerate kinase [Armatimonadia bacterium]|nr:glycerate kinase [Armatimonadia bacterium]